MKIRSLAAAALIMTAPLASAARADTVGYHLSGAGISGSIHIIYVPNLNTGVLPDTSPNPVDPTGSFVVTGATGTFSDANAGISNASITGVVQSNPANPTSTNLLAPHSFGFFPIVGGLTTPDGHAPGLSYDDLFYPSGSLQVATSYPFHGGVLDIYGLVFTLNGGDAVNVWSNGDRGGGVTYGAGVTNGLSLLDYASPVALTAVPEPGAWAAMLVGFGAIGCSLRYRRKRAAVSIA